ncbi:MAG: ComEC/Rec2 family competence protein [Candidatus Omnitrophica bacterium]|nr:ComEC/Rec2 family competence protein [Candidatus Omnitrophota bacterium]
MISPLIIITGILAIGIAAGSFIYFPVYYFLIAAVIVFFCSLIYSRHERLGDVVLLCLIFSLGCVLLKESRVLPNNHIVKIYSSIYGNAVKLSGRVGSEPEISQSKTSFVFSISEVKIRGKKISAQGNVIVNMPGRRDIQFGDTLQMTGKLYRPFAGSGNKNNYLEYLRRRNIWYAMRVPVPSGVSLIKRAFSPQQCGLRMKHIMSAALHSYLTPISGAVVDAMVFGEKKDIPVFLYNSMVKTGIVHPLAT